MKARLLYWHKALVQRRYVLEMQLHAVDRSERYRDGVRYRIILVDPKTQKRVLMDNHYHLLVYIDSEKAKNHNCTKAFRILPQEFLFYKKMNIPFVTQCLRI